MKAFCRIIISLLIPFVLISCITQTSEKHATEPIPPAPLESDSKLPKTTHPEKTIAQEAEELYNAMSLDEKVGQLFYISLMDAAEGQPLYHLESYSKNILDKVKPGGIILFAKNFESNEQTKQLIEEIKTYLPFAPFMGVDEEGGIVARLGNSEVLNFPRFPHAREIGSTGDTAQAYLTGKELGRLLKDWGFNMNMAPVADINNNPDNIIIGKRSFGENPEVVAQMCLAEMDGMRGEGIIPVLKHFPGHGDTSGDTHTNLVTLPFEKERLQNMEWIPFIKGIEAEAEVIMIGHLAVPRVTGNNLPATLSPIMMDEILRKELNFEGIIISDAYEMGAIQQNFTEKKAVIKSLLAGLDIILVPESPITSHKAVKEAILSGEIPEKIIKEKVIRIISLKKEYGIL